MFVILRLMNILSSFQMTKKGRRIVDHFVLHVIHFLSVCLMKKLMKIISMKFHAVKSFMMIIIQICKKIMKKRRLF